MERGLLSAHELERILDLDTLTGRGEACLD